MSLLHWFLLFAVVVAAISAWCDHRTGHIPSWVTLGPLLIAPVVHAGAQIVTATPSVAAQIALTSVAGALVCAIVPLVLYRAGASGGGDVKLLATARRDRDRDRVLLLPRGGLDRVRTARLSGQAPARARQHAVDRAQTILNWRAPW
jgi:Flp pilus assembly protein protease CpaA